MFSSSLFPIYITVLVQWSISEVCVCVWGGGGGGGDFLSSVSCHLTLVALLGRGRAVLPKLLSCCTRPVATVLQLLSFCCAHPVDFVVLRAPCGHCPSSARAEMTLLASSANPASSMLRLPKGFQNMPILQNIPPPFPWHNSMLVVTHRPCSHPAGTGRPVPHQ